MSLRYSTYWRRYASAAYLSIAMLCFGATQLFAQDTTVNTGGAQAADSLPPPTPPQAGQTGPVQGDMNATVQPAQPGQLTQPPNIGDVDRSANQSRQTGAQLGVYMIATEGPGVRITSVTPGSAAEQAGLQAGDFLLAINGRAIELPSDGTEVIRAHQPGNAIELRIWRNGAEHTLTATLQEFRPTVVQASGFVDPVYASGDVGYFVPGRRVVRYYYPRTYVGPGYYDNGWAYPDGYRYYPYGRYRYYGTPNFGYYDTPWGEGVRVGGFQFGWR